MTTILVVDDSAVDQRLAGGLLGKDEKLVLRLKLLGHKIKDNCSGNTDAA